MVQEIESSAPDLLALYEKEPTNVVHLDLLHTIATSRIPIIIKFYSNYCGPCRTLAPIVTRIAHEFEDTALFIEADTSTYRTLTSVFDFRFIPTILFFKNGKEIERTNGLSEEQLREKIEALV